MKNLLTGETRNMANYENGTTNVLAFDRTYRRFGAGTYPQIPRKTYDDVNGDLKLRRVLKRAVLRDRAPQSLIDSIKNGIRM